MSLRGAPRSSCLFFLLAFAAALLGCASGPRFRDQPVVWRADDQHNIPEPEALPFDKLAYFADVFVMRRLTRTLELRDHDPAQNTNALDEVPDSTWFVNRIGIRDVSAAEAARGPVTNGPPQLPLTVTRGKDTGGGNPGFFARDATGRSFLIKFDTLENPEMQTAASIVVNRVLWSAGYNVPEDTIVLFERSQLALAADAVAENDLGDKVPMSNRDVDAVLATAPRTHDGGYRASASLLLSGVPKGGFAPEGTRPDDPNDRVDHQHRRELRGLKVLAAWLGHTDMKQDNTLDMYVEEDGHRFLRHYLLDFGEALGAHQAEKDRMEDGWENAVDWEENGKALLALGLWKRPWEDQKMTPWPAIGAFGADHFDPALWKEAYPYWPFAEADSADLYWGAKLVMRFDRRILSAVVAQAQLSHPAAAAYLVNVLMGRREKIGRAWLDSLTAFDYLHVEPGRLCGVDLSVRYGLAATGSLVRVDTEGERIEDHAVGRGGEVCLPIEGDGYHVLHVRSRRGHALRPPMEVHYVGGKHARILGVVRAPP